jgi:hypothetical protein
MEFWINTHFIEGRIMHELKQGEAEKFRNELGFFWSKFYFHSLSLYGVF